MDRYVFSFVYHEGTSEVHAIGGNSDLTIESYDFDSYEWNYGPRLKVKEKSSALRSTMLIFMPDGLIRNPF